jgi:plasmid stabilization system protein ParE
VSRYTLHSEAFSDIDEIRAYIAGSDPDLADRVVTAIFDRIRALVGLPHQGYRRPDLTSRPLRFALAFEYVIAYAPERTPLRVLAVFHGRRSPRVMAAILRGARVAPAVFPVDF